ncbi:hypothetical protein PRBRB14_27160 [Hallella multisaccharivorax DSM 17128]|uniref:Uncharacterized protein n=1 Tax=Hallella multisaccharivorax DSM 17128 TaxID=688246 RepID=F8N5A0_9BACT|nr:hypothetical protein Premu_0061 [Hallella multisaccharivorax DSM 17128]GJG31837.1 hypothetical protein PRBRB14_27160 [Hallella multisaccharivorax DSM 17128]
MISSFKKGFELIKLEDRCEIVNTPVVSLVSDQITEDVQLHDNPGIASMSSQSSVIYK